MLQNSISKESITTWYATTPRDLDEETIIYIISQRKAVIIPIPVSNKAISSKIWDVICLFYESRSSITVTRSCRYIYIYTYIYTAISEIGLMIWIKCISIRFCFITLSIWISYLKKNANFHKKKSKQSSKTQVLTVNMIFIRNIINMKVTLSLVFLRHNQWQFIDKCVICVFFTKKY